MKDLVKYDSFDSVLKSIIKTEEDLSFWKKRLNTISSKIPSICRKENVFFDFLENTVSSINNEFKLDRQVVVNRYLIDAVYEYTSENFGDLIESDKEMFNCIVIFEFDEKYHNNQIEKDNNRMNEIIQEINKKYDIIEIFRIKEKYTYQFLAYAIPFFGCIETSYSFDNMRKYSEYQLIKNII